MDIRTSLYNALTIAAIIVSFTLSCSMGGSAEQGNARITGAVCGGSPEYPIVNVQLVGEGYDPFDKRCAYYATKTDSAGTYEFSAVPFGNYYLYAFDSSNAYAFLDGPYTVAREEWTPENAPLRKTSVITIINNTPNDGVRSGFYIKGMSAKDAVVVDASTTMKLTGVPAGIHDVMHHDSSSDNGRASVFTEHVEILPGDSITISQHNRPPRILYSATQLPKTVYVDTPVSLVIHAADPDSDLVVYRLITALQSATLDSMSGAVYWTPKQLETGLSQILVKVADLHGAFSVFNWNVSVKHDALTPTPPAPTGASMCTVGSVVVVTAKSSDSLSSAAAFRFSWGDGDTSAWTDAPSAVHAWTRPGIFAVDVQSRCSDYTSPSAWSMPLNVTVNKALVTQTPSLVKEADTMAERDTTMYIEDTYGNTVTVYDTLYDTIAVSVNPLACSASPLYRFFCNGKRISDWAPERVIRYYPASAGMYEFCAEAWCDTALTLPSEKSKAYTVAVNHMLPPPTIMGDSLYSSAASVLFKYSITGETTIDGAPVLHRMMVYNKYIGDGSDSSYIGDVVTSRVCIDNAQCSDTTALHLNQPTRWLSGAMLYVTLVNPVGIYTIYLQAHTANRQDSKWSTFEVKPK